MFGTEESCARYLRALCWPRGFVGPACAAFADPYEQSRGRLVCSKCRHQSTVTAGTILDKTRTELMIWLEAAWHVTTAENGVSAKPLERTLGTS